MNIKKRLKQLIIFIKCYYYSTIYRRKKNSNEDVWLICERGNDARDNGYTFYKYLKKHHKEINLKYVITKDSPDYEKIAKEDVVIYGSKEHYILITTAKYLISTHIMGFSPDFRLFTKIDKYNIIKYNGKKIFLQHGIIKDYSPGLSKENTNLDIFICGAQPEYDYLLKTSGYTQDVLKYTGLSRYDFLINKVVKKRILIMPTWRMNLYYSNKNNKFTDSSYFKNWNGLLNNKQFLNIVEKNNIEVIFYPHYEMQKYIHQFNTKSKNVIIANQKEYDVQNLILTSNILITDYSSVFFDFAYLNKEVIYFQFDYEEYRKEH